MNDPGEWNRWRRRPQPHPYYQVPADRWIAGEDMWREHPAYPQLGQRRFHDRGMAGVPGRGQYYEVPRPAPRGPYAVCQEPPPMARHGANVAPAYQAPLRPSAVLPREAGPAPRPLPFVHKQAPSAPAPPQTPAAPTTSLQSHHQQPPAAAAPPVAAVRSMPVSASWPLQATRVPSVPAPKPAPAMIPAAPPKPAATGQPAYKQYPAALPSRTRPKEERTSKPKRRHTHEHSMVTTSRASSPSRRRRSHRRRGSRTVSGFEGDARTSAGATAAESRNKTAATPTRATTRATTARRATSSSSSSSSSETAHVIQMMKTQNLPKPPPDNWHSAVRLTAAVILSGTIFSLVMVVAYIAQTTGLLSWDSINTNEGTPPNGPEQGVTVAVAFHTNDTALPFSGANDTYVKPEGHLNYDQGEGDTATVL